jgi:hypothetical protein
MDKSLLERYWNGETSLQEEASILKEMSTSADPDALYFKMIAEARKQKSRLSYADIQSFNQAHKQAAPKTMILPLYRWVASAAAILMFAVAAIGLWNYTHQPASAELMAETYEDPYEAYEEVREALAFVSAKLNKSQSEALVNIKKAGTYAEMFK